MEALGGEKRCSFYSFLPSALDGGGEFSVTPWPRFIPGERNLGTHWTGGWAGSKVGLEAEARRINYLPLPGIKRQLSSPWSHS